MRIALCYGKYDHYFNAKWNDTQVFRLIITAVHWPCMAVIYLWKIKANLECCDAPVGFTTLISNATILMSHLVTRSHIAIFW